MGAFKTRDLWRAKVKGKTFMSFQYIEGKNGRYVCSGDLGQISEFIAGALAKILINSDCQAEELENHLSTFKERVVEIYKEHKIV